MTRITIVGSGLLASQIAAQAASHDFTVTVFNHRDDFTGFERYLTWIESEYAKFFSDFDPAEFESNTDAIVRSGDLARAVENADVVIETAVENLEIKRRLLKAVEESAPSEAVLLTNSSTFLPSEIASMMQRPERLVAMHFGNMIWQLNIAEVMGQEATDPDLLRVSAAVAEEMGMVPAVIQRPLRGYLLNSMLIPFLDSGLRLLAHGNANPVDIDRVWRISTGSPYGPFQMIDIVGFNVVVHTLTHNPDEMLRSLGDKFSAEIEGGSSGKNSGSGFYLYDSSGDIVGPNPSWMN